MTRYTLSVVQSHESVYVHWGMVNTVFMRTITCVCVRACVCVCMHLVQEQIRKFYTKRYKTRDMRACGSLLSTRLYLTSACAKFTSVSQEQSLEVMLFWQKQTTCIVNAAKAFLTVCVRLKWNPLNSHRGRHSEAHEAYTGTIVPSSDRHCLCVHACA